MFGSLAISILPLVLCVGVVMVRLPATLPPLSLTHEGVGDKVRKFFGGQDIELDSDFICWREGVPDYATLDGQLAAMCDFVDQIPQGVFEQYAAPLALGWTGSH